MKSISLIYSEIPLCLALCATVLDSSAKAVQKPNVVLVIIDDMGWKQLGCYGSNFYKTPHIDSFAQQGIRFTNAYSSASVSSPTRAALMTGKNPARLHLTDYIPGSDPKDKVLITPDWQKFLPLKEVTIAEVVKKEGYRTALFGKWHLSKGKFGPISLPYNPDKQGFDETFITFKPSPDLPLGFWQKPELDGHNTDTITSRSIDFINRNPNSPFLLVVSYDAIHDPLMEKAQTIQRYKNSQGSNSPENNPVLGAMIDRVDKAFERLMNSLKQNNLLENTIVIVVSDNGGLETDASQSPLKHGKGWLYEGGIRVPMIVSWKGKIRQGIESDQPVVSMDIMPTILDLLGVQNNLPAMDGISLAPLLKGNKPLGREAIYWNYPHYHNGPPSAAIRKGKYKLIEWYEKSLTNQPDAFELFDLNEDLGENNNLAAKYPEIVAQLKQELANWRKSVGAQVPTVNHQKK